METLKNKRNSAIAYILVKQKVSIVVYASKTLTVQKLEIEIPRSMRSYERLTGIRQIRGEVMISVTVRIV